MANTYGIILVMVAGISGGLFSLGYKNSLGLFTSSVHFLTYYSISFFIVAWFGVFLFNERSLQYDLLIYGIPNGICMFLAVFFYFKLIKDTQLNTSWTVIQFNIIIPVLFSIIVFKEKLQLLTVIGFVLMVAAILCFGKGKNKGKTSTERSKKFIDVKLFLATFFSGLVGTVPKLYNAQASIIQPYALGVASSGAMLLIILILFSIRPYWNRVVFQHSPQIARKTRIRPPLTMAILQMISMASITFALSSVQGSIAFPVKSLMSLLTVYVTAFIFLKESLNTWEIAGALFSMAAIACITYTM